MSNSLVLMLPMSGGFPVLYHISDETNEHFVNAAQTNAFQGYSVKTLKNMKRVQNTAGMMMLTCAINTTLYFNILPIYRGTSCEVNEGKIEAMTIKHI